MKKLVTMGIALLLLGLVVGMPYRAMGAEEVISMPRAQGIVENARTTSFLYAFLGCSSTALIGVLAGISGIIGGVLTLLLSFILFIIGFVFSIFIIGIPILFFSLFVLFMGALLFIFGWMVLMGGLFCSPIVAIGAYFISLPGNTIQSIETYPYRIVDWATRNLRQLIDACVPF